MPSEREQALRQPNPNEFVPSVTVSGTGEQESSHVAWCRYRNGAINTCDSDAEGAFKVYRIAALEAQLKDAREAPIDMLLWCPQCAYQHVDAPEGEEWTNPPHKSHLCHACGWIWRPSDRPTNGVAEINTSDKDKSHPAIRRFHSEIASLKARLEEAKWSNACVVESLEHELAEAKAEVERLRSERCTACATNERLSLEYDAEVARLRAALEIISTEKWLHEATRIAKAALGATGQPT